KETVKIDYAVPSFPAIRHRAKRSRPPEEENNVEGSHATGDSATTRRLENTVPPPRSLEPEGRRVTQPSPAESTPELQPRKEPAEGNLSQAPIRFESQPVQRLALPAAHGPVQQSQTPTAGGVHIGNLEVRIMPAPPPAPPIIKPRPTHPSPTTVLSRSLTSSL